MNEFVIVWAWDVYHVGASVFCLMVAGAIGWIIYDSWFKKNTNGAKKE